jgi:carboxyl-terminal processing protease
VTLRFFRWPFGAAAWLVLAGCAAPRALPPGQAAQTALASGLEPPPVPVEALSGPAAKQSAVLAGKQAQDDLRRSIFVAAWTLVRDKHYDKTLGGLDWAGLRQRYEPRAIGAPDQASFYRQLNEMLGELGQSHLEVSGPGAEPVAAAKEPTGPGDPGLVVRIIEGKPTITHVRPGSSAERAGLHPGFLVTHVGGRALGEPLGHTRSLRPVEERFQRRMLIARTLGGPVESQVTIRYLDHHDRPGERVLKRETPPGQPVQIGLLPPLYPEVRVSHDGDIGVIAFNYFLVQPVLPQVQRALDECRARKAKAVILDLRGNPGGLGAMAIPVAARLVSQPLVLGTIQFRDFENTLKAEPSMGVKPFTGRVVILTDEGTASTSELLGAGLQEAGRATIVGDTTLGAVLPSAIEQLPGGAVMQYPVADFRTPKGVLIEGRGIQPDQRVFETRSAFREGRDPVLDAGLAAARQSGHRP